PRRGGCSARLGSGGAMSQQPLLHYSRQGQGQPLVILHGLFGSGSNWGSHAKWLAERYDVILPDLRNHGRSFHAPDMAYPTMAGDVLRLLDALELESVLLLGHSMGGKTAMTLALKAPQREIGRASWRVRRKIMMVIVSLNTQ